MNQKINTLPIEMSASGSNAYYCEFCNFGGHRPAYSACLGRINSEGKISSNYSDCKVAIQRRHCPALEMREEELAAGHAIYYTDRAEIQAQNEQRLNRQGVTVNRDPVERGITFTPREYDAEDQPQVIEQPAVHTSGSTFADAINIEIAKNASNPKKDTVSSK